MDLVYFVFVLPMKKRRQHLCCLPFVLLEVFEQVVFYLTPCLFQCLFHHGGDLRHQPVLLLFLFFLMIFVASAHFFFTSTFDMSEFMPYVYLALVLGFLIAACVVFFSMKNSEITVTNTRVYGTTLFGKRIDLPFDMISAVGTTGITKGITVSTSSGVIKFVLIENRDEIHEVISKILINRQSAKTQTMTKQEPKQSNADELAKYKDLLDKGIITQEEFDAKKKQLLGL